MVVAEMLRSVKSKRPAFKTLHKYKSTSLKHILILEWLVSAQYSLHNCIIITDVYNYRSLTLQLVKARLFFYFMYCQVAKSIIKYYNLIGESNLY